LVLLCTSCAQIGALVYKTAGPMPVEARYVPEPKPMLVFVEQYNAAGPEAAQDSESLARAIQRRLEEKQVAPQVDPMVVSSVRLRDPIKFRAMNISQIGAESGAEQVLYVNLTHSQFKLSEGSELMRGQMGGRVKIIDVPTGNVIWPTDAGDGFPVGVQTPMTGIREGVTPQMARADMVRQMGNAVARLFYKYQPEYDEAPD
jgi:hypothetical protein